MITAISFLLLIWLEYINDDLYFLKMFGLCCLHITYYFWEIFMRMVYYINHFVLHWNNYIVLLLLFIVDVKSLKRENEDMRERSSCKICRDAEVNVVFIPCGHLVCCLSCSHSIQKCPICRQEIRRSVKIFWWMMGC